MVLYSNTSTKCTVTTAQSTAHVDTAPVSFLKWILSVSLVQSFKISLIVSASGGVLYTSQEYREGLIVCS